jgi:ribose/xylose/arabinose/galactoside ABC-type transport system permease subunit
MDTSSTDADPQRQRDEQHLSLLAIFHYVYGGLTLFGGCFGVIYFIIAAVIFASPELVEDEEVPTAMLGGIMLLVGSCIVLLAFGVGALVIYSGMSLSRKQNYVFCMVIAALMCLNIPLGTILGIFTLVVLSRGSVKALFEQSLQ